MESLSLKKTAMAVAVASVFTAVSAPQAEANMINLSWSGAFTWLNPAGSPVKNISSDYVAGYYANGGPGYGPLTAHGWYGSRTPITGTLSFDTATGAGVGTINPFFFLGDAPGTGPNTSVAQFLNPTFQIVDTVGTIVGTMLMSWNGGGHSLSIVMDGSGLFGAMSSGAFSGGPTSTVSGVGALPATNNTNFGTTTTPIFLPLGPTPIATKTLNALGCEAQPLATQVSAYTISPTGNIANCNLTQDDGIGGSPAVSIAFYDFNFNFDMTSVHLEPSVYCLDCCLDCPPPPPVPVPPAAWLFGSGLFGLIGLARRKRAD